MTQRLFNSESVYCVPHKALLHTLSYSVASKKYYVYNNYTQLIISMYILLYIFKLFRILGNI